MPQMSPSELEALFTREFPHSLSTGTRIEEVGDRWARLRQPIADLHLRPGGTVSGPTLMALADMAMYTALLAQLGPVTLAVTTSLHIDFLRRPTTADVIARADLLKLGKRLAVGGVLLRSEGTDDPIAHASVTYSIPPR